MGTPEAGKLFLQALTGSGLGSPDLKEDSMFDTVALQTITDIRGYEGRLTCLIPVEPRVQNRYGTLHGGCIATLVDVVGSAALVTVSEKSGVSLNISVDYLRPGQAGDDVLVEAKVALLSAYAWVVKVGGLIATINVDLKSTRTGQLVAQGKHIKFLSTKDKGIPKAASPQIMRSKL